MDQSKTILIAGATSMIGQACAKSMENQKLILMGQTPEKLKILSTKLKVTPDVYVADICSEQSIKTTVTKILDAHQHIDAVIYNVGIYPWHPIESLSFEEWQKTMDTNLTGAFLLTKYCIPSMKKRGFGKFVFISSIAGESIGLPNMSAYATSKSGLNGFMRTAALELAPFNINVNSISPGKIYDPSALSQEEMETKTSSIPFKRFVEPTDIAHMAEFLISERSKNITGQNFAIDGGQSILGDKVSS